MKRKLSVLVIILMFMTTFQVIGLTNDESYAGNQLKQLGVLEGYEDGTLRLENPIKRSEVATIMVRIRGYEGATAPGEGKSFIDVEKSYWGYDYIQNAFKLSIIEGYPDNSFKPNNYISFAEVVAIMVGAVGLKDEVEGDWPYNYINKAIEVGIIPKGSKVEPDRIVTRGEMALIVWDTLLVKLNDPSILN